MPRFIALPLVGLIVAVRLFWNFILRVFFCEPLFKACCHQYGRNVHTGSSLHSIRGFGHLVLGDNVLVDGKCAFNFAARYTNMARLEIGDNSGIGHACVMTVGKRITIGRNCRIASQVFLFDAPGHASDPVARMAGQPAADEEVSPIVIEDNVWIGSRAIIMPGVTIGRDSIVAAGAVVMNNVPAGTLVAGNPARQIRSLYGSLQRV